MILSSSLTTTIASKHPPMKSLSIVENTVRLSALSRATAPRNYRSYSSSLAKTCTDAPEKTKKKKAQLYSFGKYAFYDSVVDIAHLNIVRTDAYYISRQRARLENKDTPPPPTATPTPAPSSKATSISTTPEPTPSKTTSSEPIPVGGCSQSFVFDPNAKKSGPSYEEVFGGSSKTATKSSRRDLSYRNKNKMIAGIQVPGRPIEPDNCCMSGCINCVWELFNEDLEEWKQKRTEVAKKLNDQDKNGGLGPDGKVIVWPHDWEVPPKNLDAKFISDQYKANAGKAATITPTGNAAAASKPPVDVDEIQGMPVGLQVFAMFEKKKKEQKKKKEEAKLAAAVKAAATTATSTPTPVSNLEQSRNASASL